MDSGRKEIQNVGWATPIKKSRSRSESCDQQKLWDIISSLVKSLKSYRKSGYRLLHTYTTAFYVLDISLDRVMQ